MNKNFLIVLSSPSGGGKTTLCKMIINRMDNIVYSVSATTRPARNNEIDGKDYYFFDREDFLRKKEQGYFAETAFVHGYYYGTPKINIEKAFEKGKDIIMDIDVQGALSIMKIYGNNALTIFIKPPSLEILKQRLINRNTDSEKTIEMRLKNAEIEMQKASKFKYIVINDQLEKTYSEIENIINKERALRR